jgi:choline kinase
MLADDPYLNKTAHTDMMEELDSDVQVWGAASHAGWAIWGIVQARETVEGSVDEPEFDYIAYAAGRMAVFREALQTLGIAL